MHLVQFVVGEQHHAAALADAVDRHAERIGGLEDGPQGVRPLDRGDLHPPLPAVREALGGGGQIVQIARRQAHAPQKLPCTLDAIRRHREPPSVRRNIVPAFYAAARAWRRRGSFTAFVVGNKTALYLDDNYRIRAGAML